MRRGGRHALAALAVSLSAAVIVPATAAGAFSAADEQRNFSKINERFAHEHGQPDYRVELAQRGAEREAELTGYLVADSERNPLGNLCAHKGDGCGGDVRLYDWEKRGYGLSRPVLFTARSGATLSGRVWATRSGPKKRPGIVITTGSVQAPEELYWFAATTLAKRGYVVLTYDVQGQGSSDTFGEGADSGEGVPSQSGQPFYDGTEDAVDFLLSTPAKPYVPRKSCSSGTSHAPKQQRRVAAGRNAPFNPVHERLDGDQIGIIGHSLGASAVSFVGQADPRVDAIVAYDNLRTPGGASACPSAPSTRATPKITKPALGLSNDYGLVPTPFTSEPSPQGRNPAFGPYRNAGVDTAQINIRGGTHYEFSYIPNPAFTATLRGMDLAAWYTAAWFDKYLKGDLTADARLTTNRWQQDARGARVDPTGDGNLFSSYFRSRMNVASTANPSARIVCDDLRAGCGILAPDNCEPRTYSYLSEARSRDDARSTGQTVCPDPPPCVQSAKPRGKLRGGKPMKVRLRLARKSTITISVRGKDGKRVGYRKRRLAGGVKTVKVALKRRAAGGRAQVRIVSECASGSGLTKRSVRLKAARAR